MGNTCSLRARPPTHRPVTWPMITTSSIHPKATPYVPPAFDTAPETVEKTESSST